MKRILLSMVMTAFMISQINAQFRFGLKAGANFENIKLKNATVGTFKLDNSTGWQAGALFQIKVPGIGLAVQPELLYTVSKANVNNASNDIHYFEVPINAQMGLDLKILRAYLQAGPYFGYAVKLDGDIFKQEINKFDWGVGLGAGVELWKLQFDARYSWGLQNISSVKQFEMKNNRFTLAVAFLF